MKTTTSQPKSEDFFKEEAQKAFAARDEAKRKLKEAEDTVKELERKAQLALLLEEERRKSYVDYKPDLEYTTQWFSTLIKQVGKIEASNRVIKRIDCNASVLEVIREASLHHGGLILRYEHVTRMDNSFVGILAPFMVELQLNNNVDGMRFHVDPLSIQPPLVCDLSEVDRFKETNP